MSNTSLAPPVRERVLRGIALHAGDEVEAIGRGQYEVAGSKGATYTINLGVFSDAPCETCSCPDHKRTGTTCKHIVAATIKRSKTYAASRRDRAPKVSPETVERNLARLAV